MKITKQELIDMKACEHGLESFIKQTGGTEEAVEVSSLVGGLNSYYDFMWLAGKKLSEGRILRLACDCSLLSIDLIKDHTEHFDEIKAWLINPFDDNTKSVKMYAIHVSSFDDKVRDAATAVYDAVCAARFARSASIASRSCTAACVNVYASRAAAYTAEVAWFAADSIASVIRAIESGEKRVNALLKQMFNEVE